MKGTYVMAACLLLIVTVAALPQTEEGRFRRDDPQAVPHLLTRRSWLSNKVKNVHKQIKARVKKIKTPADAVKAAIDAKAAYETVATIVSLVGR
ncbi:hypothetical protein RRG08_065880 [Elysia crispata]|uniref:Uncharacterized protein n=1 Tax=Elysia crispata TaxID=231223 RepID=A0AAE0ZGK9_9GAST|nr:hypothetical protein RRG08_065880 [Elysia crispata]